MKFWNLTNNDASTAARLDLFGIIGVDGFWEQGFDETSFKNAMGEIPEDKELEVYINSDGGSVFAAIAILNMIQRHKGKVTITVAGIAASAATIITSAVNARVVMPAGSMMMVHAPSVYAGQLNASEMRALADTLDKVGGSIVEIYKRKAKCLTDEKLADMMSTDTYLTAKEAVELGLADELDESYQIAAVREDGKLVINGLAVHEAGLEHIPAEWQDKQKGESSMTYEEFKQQHPEFYNQARNEGYADGCEDGSKNERDRIREIEDLAINATDTVVVDAKYNNPMTPADFAIAMIKAEKAKKGEFLANRQQDMQDSGLGDVQAAPNAGIAPHAEKHAAEQQEEQAFIAAAQKRLAARNNTKKM